MGLEGVLGHPVGLRVRLVLVEGQGLGEGQGHRALRVVRDLGGVLVLLGRKVVRGRKVVQVLAGGRDRLGLQDPLVQLD